MRRSKGAVHQEKMLRVILTFLVIYCYTNRIEAQIGPKCVCPRIIYLGGGTVFLIDMFQNSEFIWGEMFVDSLLFIWITASSLTLFRKRVMTVF